MLQHPVPQREDSFEKNCKGISIKLGQSDSPGCKPIRIASPREKGGMGEGGGGEGWVEVGSRKFSFPLHSDFAGKYLYNFIRPLSPNLKILPGIFKVSESTIVLLSLNCHMKDML